MTWVSQQYMESGFKKTAAGDVRTVFGLLIHCHYSLDYLAKQKLESGPLSKGRIPPLSSDKLYDVVSYATLFIISER